MQRSSLKVILSNSTWLVADRAIRLALGVFIGAWVARFLGPASFGELSYTVAYVALFQTVATLSFDGVVVRDVARDPGSAAEILGTVFWLRLMFGSASWFVAIVVIAISKGLYNPYVVLTAVLGVNLVFQSADTVDLWFQSQSQNRRTVFAKLAASVAANAFKLLLIWFRAPLVAFAAVLAFEVAAGAVALGWIYRYLPAAGHWFYRRKRAIRLLSESWPFLVAAVVNMVQARVEYVMIESFLGAASLGQYAAGARFVEIFDVIFISLTASIFPRIAIRGLDQAESTFRRVYLLAFLTYLAITPLLFIVWLSLGLIYGHGYAQARELFPWMAIRPLLGYLGITKSMAIRINFWSPYALLSSAAGAIFAATAAYFLLPRFGLYGAIAASLGSFFLSNVLLDAVFYRTNFSNLIQCWREFPYFLTLLKTRP